MVAFRLAYHCLSSTLILSLIGLTFLLIPISLRAQSEFPIDGRMSVCLDPPDPPSMVRSDGEKQNFQDCRRWSDYTETYSFIDQKKFTTAPCDPKIPPVNLFAWHLLKIWVKRLNWALHQRWLCMTALGNTTSRRSAQRSLVRALWWFGKKVRPVLVWLLSFWKTALLEQEIVIA